MNYGLTSLGMAQYMFPPTDNPARRLAESLTSLTGYVNIPIIRAFSEVFKFPAEDKVSFFKAIGHLNDLADQVIYQIRKIPNEDHDFYLKSMGAIQAAISPNSINDDWSSYRQHLVSGALHDLRHCAYLLGKFHTENDIDKTEIATLKARVAELYEMISASELDSELKFLIYDLLTTLQIALDDYKIKGTDGIKRAVIHAFGVVHLNKEKFKNSSSPSAVKDIDDFFKTVITTISVAYKIKQLGGDIVRALPI